jgi:hypothetical protein
LGSAEIGRVLRLSFLWRAAIGSLRGFLKMKRLAVVLCAGSLLLALAPGLTLASTYTLDQSNQTAEMQVINSAIDAQTFTPAMYGPIDSIDLNLYSLGANVTVSIEDTAGTPPLPNDTVLATVHQGVSTPSGQTWVHFNFPTGPVVIPGHVYAIIIFATDNTEVYGSTNDVYPGGQALTLRNLAWVPEPTADFIGPADWAFKENVGAAAPTPTPTPAPTRTPAPTPTHAAAPAATRTPVVTPAPTSSTLGASAAPAASAAAASPASDSPTPGPGDSAAAAASPSAAAAAGAGTGSGTGSGSSGQSDAMLPLAGGLVALAVLAGGGLWFLRMRRRAAAA